ncbi:Zinc finger, C3HC-like [Quillaja saponaria]|uniref:Zinc finger, C3HC-like n=1 Tax=Quillaja saponaria TaxID=32244 RepID=A0AAD7KX18_QUISA|nr:Zinc finger, C3HC-like [Quillaja saponaria]
MNFVSSAGASSPAVPMNVGSINGSTHGQVSKAASLSCVGSQPPWISLSTSAGGSAFQSSLPSCRPWERGDLLRRLATFKPSNWFGKPERGWMDFEVDKIVCESCGACLSFASSPSWTQAEVKKAGESFAKQLDSRHKDNCTWRGNSCPDGLVQFPPAPQSALIGGYKDRCDGIVQFQYLPKVAVPAIEQMRASRGPQIERFLVQLQNLMSEVDLKSEGISELESSRDEAFYLYFHAQKLISLCGWEPRWLLNVHDCEEHSAQSARNGYSFHPTETQVHLSQDPGPCIKAFSTTAKKNSGKSKVLGKECRLESRSPLLDCSLCGATVRILDFLIVPRPACIAPNNLDVPDTSKKMGLTRGVSAASGINGRDSADDTEKNRLKTMMKSCKRNFEEGGSSDYRPFLRLQHQADSVEGTVIDRDGDEVTDGRQYSAGPSKRARDTDIYDTYCSSYQRDFSGADPSHSVGLEVYADANQVPSLRHGSDQFMGIHSARNSTRASSVIAMDTICHSANDDSMESVENYPETTTAQARDGISGGSVGMCASHEAEIHGACISVHRADSVVGDLEPRVEDAENQGQTGESVPYPRLMDEIVPDDINREDPNGDSQEMLSLSVGRGDSGSKIDGSSKAESVESGEKISASCKLVLANSTRPSHSCNAVMYSESDLDIANWLGPPKEESNYEAAEFDPIAYHNQFCPWVNGNVAAAGSASSGPRPSTSADAMALCGWQLTLDALDALRFLGHNAIQAVQSQSAASLYKVCFYYPSVLIIFSLFPLLFINNVH